ncbi:DUF4097 family beta strand repeat-containing protein [Lysobacter sp. TAF61]|uniref:hypothetical protein n=1 Tax=Lysobacter sp. TAF61 TaxID=3233072 RepID=UPI003F9B7315
MKIRTPVVAAALSLSFSLLPVAHAGTPQCLHTEARNLQLDLAGVKTVVFDIGPHDLIVTATPNARGAVDGKACASDADRLKDLTLTQQRVGDKLMVTAERSDGITFNWSGNHYAYLDLKASVPDNVMVQLKVGSGDAQVKGASALSIDLGSGDVEARDIRGLVTADLNSGDIKLDSIGSLQVLSVGSGDFTARRIGRGATVGSIGSGDVELVDVDGDVSVDRIGSGDLDVRNVRGNLTVHRVGSGSVDHSGVSGRTDVPQDN